MLPNLPLGRVLSHLKQETSCIYVNNAGPWNAIVNFAITVLRDQLSLVLVLTTTLSLPYLLRLKCDVKHVSVTLEVVLPSVSKVHNHIVKSRAPCM